MYSLDVELCASIQTHQKNRARRIGVESGGCKKNRKPVSALYSLGENHDAQ